MKPIALHLVQQIASDPEVRLPISGIGGIAELARRGGVHARGVRDRPGLHGRHALRVPDRGGHDRRTVQLDGREGLPDPGGFPRPLASRA